MIIIPDVHGRTGISFSTRGTGFFEDSTKEEILVADDMNQLSAVTSDGNYVYLCDYENVYVYDFDGMLTDTIPCPSATVLFGDGEYLFVEAFQEPGTDVEKEGGTMHMWVLDKSQIGSEHKQWMNRTFSCFFL